MCDIHESGVVDRKGSMAMIPAEVRFLIGTLSSAGELYSSAEWLSDLPLALR